MFSYEYHNLDPQVIMSLSCLPLVSYKECQGKLKLVVYKKAGKIGLVFCNALRRSELSKQDISFRISHQFLQVLKSMPSFGNIQT